MSFESTLVFSSNRLEGIHAVASAPDAPVGTRSSIPPRNNSSLRRFGLFTGDRSGCAHSRAVTPYDLELAYRLVYRVYVKCGYVTPSNLGLRMGAFEMCPETATFVSKSPSSSVVGVLSIVEDSNDMGLPSEQVFHKEINSIRKAHRRVFEISNQVVSPDFRNTGISGELVRCAYAHAFYVGCTDIVCSVSPQMTEFYKSMGFQIASDVKSYSTTVNDPVVLIHFDRLQTRYTTDAPSSERGYAFCKKYLHDDNPYHAKMRLWLALNEYMFSEPLGLSSLFCRCPDIIDEGSQGIRASLKRRLGNIYELSKQAAQYISRDARPVHFFSDRPSRVFLGTSKPSRPSASGPRRPINRIQFQSFDRRSSFSRKTSLPLRLTSSRDYCVSKTELISQVGPESGVYREEGRD